MIKISNIETYGVQAAIRGMRNPLNSWDDSDSNGDILGEKDCELAFKLTRSGPDHRKFLRMIHISMDICAPLYWWKEFDTYKVGTVANSCSTMHKIASKRFTLDDFSHEHLLGEFGREWGDVIPKKTLDAVIFALNQYRDKYNAEKDPERKKVYWWQMIQLLPSSYNQLRTVDLNYEVARNQYFARRNHKLDEWHTYCHALESLPYCCLITEEEM